MCGAIHLRFQQQVAVPGDRAETFLLQRLGYGVLIAGGGVIWDWII